MGRSTAPVPFTALDLAAMWVFCAVITLVLAVIARREAGIGGAIAMALIGIGIPALITWSV